MAADPIQRKSLGDQVTDATRMMILEGVFRPGDAVKHDVLAKRLNVSTMPVREALLRLTQDGLLIARSGRSFQVAPLTRADIDDIYWAHAILSGELTARACRQGDKHLISELNEVQALWDANGTDPARAEELNYRFHRAINLAADSPRLIHLLRFTLRLIPDRFYALVPGWREVSMHGHRAIIDAIEGRDEERARAASEAHVREAGALLVEYFNDSGFWSSPDGESSSADRGALVDNASEGI